LASIRAAIDVERRIATKTSSSRALKDLLQKTTADYNRMVTLKRHRIDGPKKSLCYNMFLVSNMMDLSRP